MGKVLLFKDGSQLEFTSNSTASNLFAVVTSYSAIDNMRAKFTEENLEGATFDGVVLHDYIPVSSSATASAEGNITVNFVNALKSNAEIEELQKRITELEAENESLVTENANLSDKAEAADILLGNTEVD